MNHVVKEPTTVCHVLAVPFPSRGHINPMMNLCKLILSKNKDILVTFVVSEEWLGFIGLEPKPDNIRFGTIPNDFTSELDRSGNYSPDFFEEVLRKMEDPLDQLIDRLEPPVTTIIYDTYLTFAVRVGNRRNIPLASFWTMPALVYSVFHHFDLLIQNRHFPINLLEQGEELVDCIPGVSSIRKIDLPTCLYGKGLDVLHRGLEAVSGVSRVQYLLLVSVYELESQIIDALKEKISTPIYHIGPPIPHFKLEDNSGVNPSDKSYFQWLDLQPPTSVLYVAQGSLHSATSAQLDELAAGLRISGVRYFWVARKDTPRFKDECGEMGLIVPWCDQLRVLCHPSDETTPSVPMLAHARIVSFLGFLLLLDSLFLYSSIKFLIQTRQASVSLFFSFEYMILATTTVSTFVKYVFYVSDMLMEGQWEKKAVYTFYLELVRDLLHLSMYLCFFLVIFVNYGVPLHLIRELYETFRNFKIRIADYLRYRKITSNMNDRFPDATPEELTANDATCIICREEMTTAKKLICGHLFHVHCLRSWLERQHTCPTCRALVVPSENGTSSSGGQHVPQTDAHRQGSSTSSATQGPGADMATDNLTRHQARLQAAAAAASIYEKSYVYPSASTLAWYPGNAVLPKVYTPLVDSTKVESSGESTSIGQQQFAIPGAHGNVLFSHFPHCVFSPFQLPGANGNSGEGLGSGPNIPDSQLEAQKKIIQQQMEVLQHQLQLLQMQKPKTEESMDIGLTAASDSKGKAVASSSSSEE